MQMKTFYHTDGRTAKVYRSRSPEADIFATEIDDHGHLTHGYNYTLEGAIKSLVGAAGFHPCANQPTPAAGRKEEK
jgi:hypothetical protein